MNNEKRAMATYDPNIRWAKHEVEITYQSWEYAAVATVSVRGNCKGFSIIESALSMHADKLYEDQGENTELTLTRTAADGSGQDTLHCSPDGEDIEQWLAEMCVGVRIISHFAIYSAG